MSSAGIPDLVELLNTLSSSLNVFYPLIKRDLHACCRALVFSERLYEATFSRTKPWHRFVTSIWLSRTGAAGVKFVVSDSSLPSPPSGLTVALEDEERKACSRTFVSSVTCTQLLWDPFSLKTLSQLRLVLSSSPFASPGYVFLSPINWPVLLRLAISVKYAIPWNNKLLAGENLRLGHDVLALSMQGRDTLCSSSIHMKDLHRPPKGHFTSHALNIYSRAPPLPPPPPSLQYLTL